jgi:hypothetical protein
VECGTQFQPLIKWSTIGNNPDWDPYHFFEQVVTERLKKSKKKIQRKGEGSKDTPEQQANFVHAMPEVPPQSGT